MTKLFDFKNGINKKELSEIKDILLNDGIVVLPTETVYGLGASIYSEVAINKIFEAKGRPNDNPLIVHISSMDMLEDIAHEIDYISKKLMNIFWPGPLTIILPKKNNISNIVSADLDTVGIRMPSGEIMLKIIEFCNVPLAAPSANISGRPSGTNIDDIYDELNGRVDAIVDGGLADIGIESTVVLVKNNVVNILRPGKITTEDIKSLGLEVVENNLNKEETPEKVLSPGVKYKHYAPSTKAILVYSKTSSKMVDKINELIEENKDKKVLVIGTNENKNKYNCETLIMGSNLDEISKSIFRILRSADKLNADLIIIEGVESKGIGTAIMNRLIKACSYNYIEVKDD